jgi:hypothetical protein
MCRHVCDDLSEWISEAEDRLAVGQGHARVVWKVQGTGIGLVARGGFATQRVCRVGGGAVLLSGERFVGWAMLPRNR